MLMAAVAVSVGVAPVVPPDNALLNSVSQAVPGPGPAELMHGAKMSARVLISLTGTVPLPAGVVESGWPVARLARFAALSAALAIPVAASAEFDPDMSVASVA